MKNKIVIITVCVVLCLALLPLFSFTASAAESSYFLSSVSPDYIDLSYTNILPDAIDSSGSVLDGKGYRDNAYLSSSGGYSSSSGYFATGYFPYVKDSNGYFPTLYFKGSNFNVNSMSRVKLVTSSFGVNALAYNHTSGTTSSLDYYFDVVEYYSGYYKLVPTNALNNINWGYQNAYIAFSMPGSGSDFQISTSPMIYDLKTDLLSSLPSTDFLGVSNPSFIPSKYISYDPTGALSSSVYIFPFDIVFSSMDFGSVIGFNFSYAVPYKFYGENDNSSSLKPIIKYVDSTGATRSPEFVTTISSVVMTDDFTGQNYHVYTYDILFDDVITDFNDVSITIYGMVFNEGNYIGYDQAIIPVSDLTVSSYSSPGGDTSDSDTSGSGSGSSYDDTEVLIRLNAILDRISVTNSILVSIESTLTDAPPALTNKINAAIVGIEAEKDKQEQIQDGLNDLDFPDENEQQQIISNAGEIFANFEGFTNLGDDSGTTLREVWSSIWGWDVCVTCLGLVASFLVIHKVLFG